MEQPGRVRFAGTLETICLANLWLRTADRVMIRVADFPAGDFEQLFESTRGICWGNLITNTAEFPVTGRSIRSQLSSIPACQRAIKRAVVDALMRDHQSNHLPETGPTYRIDFTIVKDQATLAIDTTGPGLNRRGYHTAASQPRVKETLAAAMVMLSYWKPGRPLIDPFCGGGTVAIEAARLGRNIAPGRDRSFACERWPDLPASLWETQRDRVAAEMSGPLETKINAADIAPAAIRAARENAVRAGVADDIHFQVKSMQQTTSRRRFGCLITCPPDQQGRVSDRELKTLYAELPEVFRKLPTWSHYLLTSFPELEASVGRQADRRRKLYKGRTESTFYQFHGPKPVSNLPATDQLADRPNAPPHAVPEEDKDRSRTQPAVAKWKLSDPVKPHEHASGPAAFGQLSIKATEQADLFAVRLKKRARHLRRWPTKRGITCYRLYERDIPEIPLVVDIYEDCLHITEFERPHQRTPAEHGNWLDLMTQTAGQALGVEQRNIYFKRRGRQQGKTQHNKVAETQQRKVVGEGGLKFLVNLADYVDTGLFLDHRQTRQMVREAVRGKVFLNLFAYTGSFTVYAAHGGAKQTTSVDLSRNYLNWAQANLSLNGFDGDQHRFVAADVDRFIADHPARETYDVVVVDPPTFSNSKRTTRDWSVQHGATELLVRLMPLVRQGGVVFFSTNFRRFQFDPQSIPASEVLEISRQTVPEDFRNRRIHRCWRITR